MSGQGVRAGWPGLIAGGTCFVLPAMLMVIGLGWVYQRYGSTPEVGWLLYGIKPVVIGLILNALWALGRRAVKGWLTAVVGAVVLGLYFLGYNISIAVWVGMIALMGLDAETGVFMLLFLDLSYYERVRAGTMRTFEDLTEAVVYGAVKRIRPKMMTVCAAFIGLMPIMWSVGTGADMMKRVAAPLVGGLVTSFILELIVYPAVYTIWKWRFEMKHGTADLSQLPTPYLRGH
jgi:Cu(I)/Ag(I) efflux system membrane protein CusA/SilA